LTSDSNTFVPSACARENAPSPASQIWRDESSTDFASSFSPPLSAAASRSALAFFSMSIFLVVCVVARRPA